MSQPTVIWEITRSCELDCPYCPQHDDDRRPVSEELSTYEAYQTVDQIASLKPRQLNITGGDPLARNDLFQIAEYAHRRGLKPALTVIPTAKLTVESIEKLHQNGVARLIFSVNGSTPQRHDILYGVRGSFDATVSAIRRARRAGLPVEVDTLVTRRTMTDLGALADLLADLDIEAWNAHFVVPIGKSRRLEVLTSEGAERTFEILAAIQQTKRFHIRTVEAPEYRRYLSQRRSDAARWPDFETDCPDDLADCARDEVVFIGAGGAVRPSEFLPVAAGNIRYRPLFAIVRASDLFVAFRDRSNLTGKCGRCEYRALCGGSRARAWAMTGLLFGPDPLCAYEPRTAAPMEDRP